MPRFTELVGLEISNLQRAAILTILNKLLMEKGQDPVKVLCVSPPGSGKTRIECYAALVFAIGCGRARYNFRVVQHHKAIRKQDHAAWRAVRATIIAKGHTLEYFIGWDRAKMNSNSRTIFIMDEADLWVH